jgi:hypothetical protein
MKQDYTLYIYKADKRTKSGERLLSTTVWPDRDSAEQMARDVRELECSTWPKSQGYRCEYFPTMKTVKNLMTGKDVQIAHDTPRSCDPSSELYWSM